MSKEIIEFFSKSILLSVVFFPLVSIAHDTTHIHPLITDKIAALIDDTDVTGAYTDIYEPNPNKDPKIPPTR